jgi:hypothetical protein
MRSPRVRIFHQHYADAVAGSKFCYVYGVEGVLHCDSAELLLQRNVLLSYIVLASHWTFFLPSHPPSFSARLAILDHGVFQRLLTLELESTATISGFAFAALVAIVTFWTRTLILILSRTLHRTLNWTAVLITIRRGFFCL